MDIHTHVIKRLEQQQQQQQGVRLKRAHFFCGDLHRKTLTVDMDVERGAAWRRRQRRLRWWWRHEQQTVAAVLATVTHHSHSKVDTAYDALRGQKQVTRPAEYYELSSDDGRPTGGERPAALLEPWPQGKMERHDNIAYELVQALDAPVVQTVEQLPNVVQFFATQLLVVAEPVIEVPKILPHDVPPRRWCRDTQLVEQLVEVPTPVSYSSLLQRTVEQHVDIPVPRGGGRNAGLQGFLPEQSSTTTFSSAERISERIMEQIVDFPVAGGGLHDFRPGQSSSSVAHSPAAWLNTEDEPFQGVFALFPRKKKVRLTPGTWVRECPGTSAHPRRLLMACAVGWMTTRVRLGRCSRIRRSARGGTACARTPVAPAVGALSLAVAGGVRSQGLGIPWPLLGCPCRLRGRLNILESSMCLGCGGSAVTVDVPAGAVHHRLCPCAHVETLFCLQFLDLVDMPVIVHCQVRSH